MPAARPASRTCTCSAGTGPPRGRCDSAACRSPACPPPPRCRAAGRASRWARRSCPPAGRWRPGRRRGDFFPPLVVIAAEEHVGLGRPGALLHHVGHGAAGADRHLILLGRGQLLGKVLIGLVLAAEPEVPKIVVLGLAPLGGRLA